MFSEYIEGNVFGSSLSMYPMGLSSVLDVRRSEENIPPTYRYTVECTSEQAVQLTTAIAEKTVRLLKSAIAVVSAKAVVACIMEG